MVGVGAGAHGSQLEVAGEVLRRCAPCGDSRSSRGILNHRQERQGPTTTATCYVIILSRARGGEIKLENYLRTDDCKMARAWVLSAPLKTKRRNRVPSKRASQRRCNPMSPLGELFSPGNLVGPTRGQKLGPRPLQKS
jgi:hypothetical protein